MRQGPLTAIACRPSRLPFNGCILQPGMFRSESAVAAWSASIALLHRLCRSGCTFRLLPVSKSSRNPACRKLTITVSTSVKQTRQSVNYRFTLRPALTLRDVWQRAEVERLPSSHSSGYDLRDDRGAHLVMNLSPATPFVGSSSFLVVGALSEVARLFAAAALEAARAKARATDREAFLCRTIYSRR